MDKTKALQNLLKGKAKDEEIELLKQALASGEISIGGNVSNSVIIQGSENNVQVFQLTPEMLELLGGHQLLGNLERDLNGDEIALGLERLEAELPLRAPVLTSQFQEQARRLRPTLKTNPNALIESARKERLEALAHVNSLCMEALDISFNAVATGEAPPEYEARCPFRGLESFRVEDRDFFFGREELTRKLVGKIQAHSFLAVLGASGSGKSSLVMAGMIPALNLDYAVIRPGTNPLDALDSARGKSLLVVDQFEELFTLTRDEKTRTDFISALLDSTRSGRVIITLRSDFLGEAGTYRSLSGEIQNHLEIIPPMNADELRRAMEGQAHWARLEFEADLSQQILDDVAGEPGAMPLLQHALWELWNRRHGRHLRANEYRAFGGVKQAITSTAEKVYTDCSKPEQEQVRDIFLRLTRLDEGDEGRDTRRRVTLGDLIPSGADAASISALLDKLANARLIVKTVNNDLTEIEVAHEALIRHWERLRIWLNEDRDNLRLRESVSESAKEWERSGRHESLLNSRWVKLDEALLLAQDSRYRLTDIEQAYLKGCVALRNWEQRERERRRKITLTSIFAVIGIIMTIVTGWGISSTKSANANATQVSIANKAQSDAKEQANAAAAAQAKAEEQASIAISGKLAAYAISEVTSKSDRTGSRALLLAREAVLTTWEKYGSVSIEADAALRQAVANAPPWMLTLQYSNRINAVAWSPDGTSIIIASGEKAYIWDIEAKQQISELVEHVATISSVSWSPNGTQIATGDINGIVVVWDIVTGERFLLSEHTGDISSIDWSLNGKSIVTASADGTIRIWDTSNRKEIKSLVGDSRHIWSATWNPNGTRIASVSDDGVIQIWDVATGNELGKLTGHTERVLSVSWSPDGRFIVTTGSDMTIRIWDVINRQEVRRMIGHYDVVWSVKWSPDGTLILSTSDDGTVRIWDSLTGDEILQLTGHSGYVRSAAWSPDGTIIITGGEDRSVRMWGIKDKILRRRLAMDGNTINVAEWSPDGLQIATSGPDGIVRLWDTTKGKELYELTGHKGHVYATIFNPDGTLIASGGPDGTTRIWRVATGEGLQELVGHSKTIRSLSWSPDGSYIVSAGDDGTARIWDILTGQELCQLKGHNSSILSVAWNPKGNIIASAGADNSIRIWDTSKGVEMRQVNGHTGWIYSVDWSPDGKLIVSASADETARIWDATNGQELTKLNGHTGTVRSVSWSPDGSLIATTSDDGSIRIWMAGSGTEIRRLAGHAGWVYTVSWNPDGTLIISAGADGTARIWDVSIKNLLQKAENLIQRNPPILTTEEHCLFLDQCE